MDWKQELLKRLDALAVKLGTTAEYLWRVLVKQAYVNGLMDLLIALMCFITTIVCYKMVMCALRIPNIPNGFKEGTWPDRKAGLFVPFIIVGIVALFTTCCVLVDALPLLVNPEYYALHEVLETLK